MKTLYLECNMGAAGDMLMAALLELHDEPERFIERFNGLGIPGVRISREASVKCGVTGTRISVKIGTEEEESRDIPMGRYHEAQEHDHSVPAHIHGQDAAVLIHSEHGHNHDQINAHAHDNTLEHTQDHLHTGLAEIQMLLQGLPVSDRVKADAQAVYGLIAQAESTAHGQPVELVHFHEVGAMDAVADIIGVCMLMEELSPERVMVSPVHVGCGQVKCAHGILPVPAPATAYILMGVPTYGGQIRGELCTPTGAALLKHFACEFGPRSMMSVERIGYGMGKKDFSVANCVRAFLGEGESISPDVVEIVCNLDDMTGEELGFAVETLLASGALDVYLTPVQMKKNRPGQVLTCLVKPEDEEKIATLMLKHTTSFGVRSSGWRRYTLERSVKPVQTEYGTVRVKTGRGFGVTKSKAEYEDLSKLARESGKGILEMKRQLYKNLK